MAEGEMYVEKRKHKRAYKSFKVFYKLLPGDSQIEAIKEQGEGKDVSLGGVRVVGETVGKEGDIIRIEMPVEGKENITSFAEIKWVKTGEGKSSFGVQFLMLRDGDSEIIESIVNAE